MTSPLSAAGVGDIEMSCESHRKEGLQSTLTNQKKKFNLLVEFPRNRVLRLNVTVRKLAPHLMFVSFTIRVGGNLSFSWKHPKWNNFWVYECHRNCRFCYDSLAVELIFYWFGVVVVDYQCYFLTHQACWYFRLGCDSIVCQLFSVFIPWGKI